MKEKHTQEPKNYNSGNCRKADGSHGPQNQRKYNTTSQIEDGRGNGGP
jgi:hypothetical protein